MAIRGVRIEIAATPTRLSSVLSGTVKQIDIIASPDNTDNVFLGSSAMTAAPANVWGVLQPGKAWGTEAEQGDEVKLGDDVYIFGTEGEFAHVLYVA